MHTPFCDVCAAYAAGILCPRAPHTVLIIEHSPATLLRGLPRFLTAVLRHACRGAIRRKFDKLRPRHRYARYSPALLCIRIRKTSVFYSGIIRLYKLADRILLFAFFVNIKNRSRRGHPVHKITGAVSSDRPGDIFRCFFAVLCRCF